MNKNQISISIVQDLFESASNAVTGLCHCCARAYHCPITTAKFRHSAELIKATKTALNSPPLRLRTQLRFRRTGTGAPLSHANFTN